MMPTHHVKLFNEQLRQNHNITCVEIPYLVCEPDKNLEFPDMIFTIDSKEYIIPRESYLMHFNGNILLKIIPGGSGNFWILGLNFFDNYYTVFD